MFILKLVKNEHSLLFVGLFITLINSCNVIVFLNDIELFNINPNKFGNLFNKISYSNQLLEIIFNHFLFRIITKECIFKWN